MNKKTKIKLGITVFLLGILAVFIALNTEFMEINFIIGTIEIRRSMMIITTLLIGIFAGWSLRSVFVLKSKKTEED